MPNTTLQRLLYIEDDEGLARLLQRRLERKRFRVHTASSAEEGLEKIKKFDYDLILLDYHLPGMNGLELLDALAELGNTSPVIILTASGDESVAVAALEKGASDYAVKDAGQNYFDLLPAIMQAAFTREMLTRENERQRQELSEAKEKAEAASDAKSSFLATMSHEIRTPLNVVTGLTNILARTKLDAEQTKIVNTLSSNANLLLKLINDLMDISRIEVDHVVLESTPFTFSAVLDDIRQMFEEQGRRKNIRFVFNNETHEQRFNGDRTRVQQILMNLVSNAIKFTDAGEIEITARLVDCAEKPDCIEIKVRDSGIGIAAENLPTIFDKFTQADPTITRRYGGSGLGLSIARSLARMMEGDINVESTPGIGSTFTAVICLPISTQAADDIVEIEDAELVKATNAGGDVLLVEDYAPNTMVATMMLEDMGYKVTSAENGHRALEIAASRSAPFIAILMDVQMQGMDGLETTRRIREIDQKKGFRHTIIGVTAHALAGDRERCLQAGMDDYVSKPIHPDILAAKLRVLA